MKCHPALTSHPSLASPLCRALSGGTQAGDRLGWASRHPSRDQPVPRASLWVPKSPQLFSTPGSHPTLQGAARPAPALPSTTGASPQHRHTTSPRLASPSKPNCLCVPQQAAHVVPVTHGCCGQHVQSFFCQNRVGWVWGHSSMFMAQEDVPRPIRTKLHGGTGSRGG